MKNIYSYHPVSGVFVGTDFAQESPLEPGVFLLPAGATFVEPPQAPEGKQSVWNGDSWEVQDIPLPEPPLEIPEPEPELLTWDRIRVERNFKLSQSDWTQLSDAPLSPEQKQAWAVYRQALREVPSSFATPEEVIWPIVP
jgi:Phage tail assembly chaperone protein